MQRAAKECETTGDLRGKFILYLAKKTPFEQTAFLLFATCYLESAFSAGISVYALFSSFSWMIGIPRALFSCEPP
jgi:hypothetical protein